MYITFWLEPTLAKAFLIVSKEKVDRHYSVSGSSARRLALLVSRWIVQGKVIVRPFTCTSGVGWVADYVIDKADERITYE